MPGTLVLLLHKGKKHETLYLNNIKVFVYLLFRKPMTYGQIRNVFVQVAQEC